MHSNRDCCDIAKLQDRWAVLWVGILFSSRAVFVDDLHSMLCLIRVGFASCIFGRQRSCKALKSLLRIQWLNQQAKVALSHVASLHISDVPSLTINLPRILVIFNRVLLQGHTIQSTVCDVMPTARRLPICIAGLIRRLACSLIVVEQHRQAASLRHHIYMKGRR